MNFAKGPCASACLQLLRSLCENDYLKNGQNTRSLRAIVYRNLRLSDADEHEAGFMVAVLLSWKMDFMIMMSNVSTRGSNFPHAHILQLYNEYVSSWKATQN